MKLFMTLCKSREDLDQSGRKEERHLRTHGSGINHEELRSFLKLMNGSFFYFILERKDSHIIFAIHRIGIQIW